MAHKPAGLLRKGWTTGACATAATTAAFTALAALLFAAWRPVPVVPVPVVVQEATDAPIG